MFVELVLESFLRSSAAGDDFFRLFEPLFLLLLLFAELLDRVGVLQQRELVRLQLGLAVLEQPLQLDVFVLHADALAQLSRHFLLYQLFLRVGRAQLLIEQRRVALVCLLGLPLQRLLLELQRLELPLDLRSLSERFVQLGNVLLNPRLVDSLVLVVGLLQLELFLLLLRQLILGVP